MQDIVEERSVYCMELTSSDVFSPCIFHGQTRRLLAHHYTIRSKPVYYSACPVEI